MEYTIRPAAAADEKKIRELFVEMLRTIYHTESADGYEEGYLDKYWGKGEDRIYIAEAGGEAAGFVSAEVYHDPVDHVYVDDFSVTAGCRGRGIGSALLRAAEGYAGENGCRAVLLHVEKTNAAAMRFYERAGYAVFRDDGNRFLLKKDIEDGFIEALRAKDTGKLLAVPKSDLHNHSTKGCRRAWLAERLKGPCRIRRCRWAGSPECRSGTGRS